MCDGKREGEKRREESKGGRVTLGEPVIERMTGKGNGRGKKSISLFLLLCGHSSQTAGNGYTFVALPQLLLLLVAGIVLMVPIPLLALPLMPLYCSGKHT